VRPRLILCDDEDPVTAITLNLLVEEQLAQEAEARDPVKLVAAGGICLIAAAVLLGMAVARSAARKAADAAALQSKWDTIESHPSASTGDTKSYQALVEEIRMINRTRPLYAPQLAIIKDVVPETIQLTQIGLSYVMDEAAPAPEPPPAASTTGDKPARRVRPKSREHMFLVLNGQAACTRPEIEVDEFLKKIQADPALSKSFENVRLRSIARAPIPADAAEFKAPTAMFAIDCQYKGQ
jgi:hypothetical protein